MTCSTCGDRGLVLVNYTDGDEYGICLCPAGERMRIARNNGRPCMPHWQIWAHQRGIPLEHVHPIEDILTAEELAARGFRELTAPADALSAIASAAKKRGARL